MSTRPHSSAEAGEPTNNGITHWEGCWREHHACALAEIERLTESYETALADGVEYVERLEAERDAAVEALEKVKRWLPAGDMIRPDQKAVRHVVRTALAKIGGNDG